MEKNTDRMDAYDLLRSIQRRSAVKMFMNAIVVFVLDFIMCYVVAISLMVPIFNVFFLRTIMNRNKAFQKHIKRKR